MSHLPTHTSKLSASFFTLCSHSGIDSFSIIISFPKQKKDKLIYPYRQQLLHRTIMNEANANEYTTS